MGRDTRSDTHTTLDVATFAVTATVERAGRASGGNDWAGYTLSHQAWTTLSITPPPRK